MNSTQEKTIANASLEAKAFHALLSGALTHSGKDESLPRLFGVYLWREGGKIKAVATDRYRLIVGEIESEGEGESSPVRLAYDDAKALVSTLSKEKKGFSRVEITLAGDILSAKVGASSLTFTTYADELPPYAHLFPQEGAEPMAMPHVSFNPSFFADYGKIAGKKAQVIVRQYGENKAFEIVLDGDLEKVTWRALLMPMRVR